MSRVNRNQSILILKHFFAVRQAATYMTGNHTETPQMVADIPQEEDLPQEPEELMEKEPEEEQEKEDLQEDDD